MFFSLWLRWQQFYQKKIQQEFDRRARVLSAQDIQLLIAHADRARSLRIFRSAAADHLPVEGWPYYLRYPVSGLFYHDGFKRVMIAEVTAQWSCGVKDSEAFTDAEIILEALSDIDQNPGYVVVLAWWARGLLYQRRRLPESVLAALKEAFGGPVASVLGGIVFLDQLREQGRSQEAEYLIGTHASLAKYRVQRALIDFYRSHRHEHPRWSMNDLTEGFRHIGLLPRGMRQEFWRHTPHGDIARRMERIAGVYLEFIADLDRV